MMGHTSTNMVQKINIQTLRASFAPRTLTDCRKSSTFATLRWGIEHEIEGIFWSFATFKVNS